MQFRVGVCLVHTVFDDQRAFLSLDCVGDNKLLRGFACGSGKAYPTVGQNRHGAVFLDKYNAVFAVRLVVVADFYVECHCTFGDGDFCPHHSGRVFKACARTCIDVVFKADTVGTAAFAHVENLLVAV